MAPRACPAPDAPRPQVLFDTLKFHGSAFSPAFWERVFDKILLPVFDAVRAEGLDTGREAALAAAAAAGPEPGGPSAAASPPHTSGGGGAGAAGEPPVSPGGGGGGVVSVVGGDAAASAARDTEVDAWLYETCAHCLHLIVDLVVQFFSSVSPLLPRLLLLLQQLTLRPHEALSASGVAALQRLVASAGPLLSPAQWCDLAASLCDTLRLASPVPLAEALAGPPGGEGAAGGGGGAAGGARWLARAARCRGLAHTQQALLAAAQQLLQQHAASLPRTASGALVEALAGAHRGAARLDADHPRRARLRANAAAALAEAADAAPALRLAAVLGDPPLVALEVAAGCARLAAAAQLLRASSASSAAQAAAQQPQGASEAESRLAGLLAELLAASGGPGADQEARAPLATAALRAAADAFSPAAFGRAAPVLLPACMALLRTDAVPATVRDALARMIESRLVPLALAPPQA